MRSRAAIEKIGATREGVLRRYQRRSDATVRDTVMYSVVAEEWPVVRDKLSARLN
jgi:aminoglycoside 6'-N-acetyltransferase